ncbi:competence protein CoiA [Simkania sp.]|uniref:competence protein CoiA n=1 Tax=Simkania sp. TaxID=34094 RepID=UPI003B528705
MQVKEGLHRRKHFFHFRPSSFCRQSGKTEVHLTIQKKILQSLPEGHAVLEKRFPSINRIADVVWEAKKRVFEVQCSPISLQEVKERMADYASVGYQVIWILHDYRFNRKRLSAAEYYLRPFHAFFTSINAKGRGFFYDQYERLSSGMRVEKGPPRQIDIGHPPQNRPKPPPQKSKLPELVKDWSRFLYYLILKQGTQ